MTRHVVNAALNSKAQPLGRLPSNETMRLDIVVPLRDPAGLDDFLKQVYDPGSPVFRQFLTPQEFTERFGPTQENYNAVVEYLKANGFTIVGGTRDGMDVEVKGPVSVVETAFHVNMLTYRHPTESRDFHGPDREPTVDLPFKLWHVFGMDNFSIPHAMHSLGSTGMSSEDMATHPQSGSGSSGSFLGSDMRAAYYGSTALTGAGQTLGLFAFDHTGNPAYQVGFNLQDVKSYYLNVGQNYNVPIEILALDGASM